MTVSEHETQTRVDALDVVLALIVGAGALCLYLATRQTNLYGDGWRMGDDYYYQPESLWIHVLYFMVARWIPAAWVQAPTDPLFLVSAIGGALGVGCCYALARASPAGT